MLSSVKGSKAVQSFFLRKLIHFGKHKWSFGAPHHCISALTLYASQGILSFSCFLNTETEYGYGISKEFGSFSCFQTYLDFWTDVGSGAQRGVRS